MLNYAVSPSRLRAWMLMEFSGILPNKKRKTLIKELEKLGFNRQLDAYEKMIIMADMRYSQDRRERMRFLKQELKSSEKIGPY